MLPICDGCVCECEIQRNTVFENIKNSWRAQNVKNWMGGRNLGGSLIYSSVQKGQKES